MTNGIPTNITRYMNVFENDRGQFSITDLASLNDLEDLVFKKVPFSTFDLESNIMQIQSLNEIDTTKYKFKINKDIEINGCPKLTMLQIFESERPPEN